jgi:hypothetical protein
MLPLIRCRTSFLCKGCNTLVEKGTMSLGLGMSWGRCSNGKCCLECIVKTAEEIKKEVII